MKRAYRTETSEVHAGSERHYGRSIHISPSGKDVQTEKRSRAPKSRLRYATRKIIFVSKGIANEITLAILSPLRQVFCPCSPASKVTTKPQRSSRLMIKHKCIRVRARAYMPRTTVCASSSIEDPCFVRGVRPSHRGRSQ